MCIASEPRRYKPRSTPRQKKGYQGASCVCQKCQNDARFVERRGRTITCLLGGIRVRRPYYHCAVCSEGLSPWDQELGLSKRCLSPAVAELSSLAGTVSSFAVSAKRMLLKMTGLRVSESSVERVTEDAGARVGKLLEDRIKFGADREWKWQRDALGRTCAYASLDAKCVRRQGPKASRVEGRMAYVASIYNPDSEYDETQKKPHQSRYLSGFYELNELGLQLRRQAGQVGWDKAEVQIALSDGGNGMEQFLRRNFPLATIIIDFWHVKEYLVELAKALFADEHERQSWMDRHAPMLKHEGGPAVLAQLKEIDPGPIAATRELYRVTVQYFENHQHKMDYPSYVKNGWQIGSGPIESACRTVVGDRLNGSGMRWGNDGADALCHLRALFLSEPDQWDAFWEKHRN
ncbi:ISKra4 family transposase [Lignipirellula cremea]|uniref:ISKra4 family transposase n=1 Tax=Lignipirellula cremea TaxID=2528010 RepID=UPI0018D234C2|nr:ISKra4 family transposase [Lignipirellula cremea]